MKFNSEESKLNFLVSYCDHNIKAIKQDGKIYAGSYYLKHKWFLLTARLILDDSIDLNHFEYSFNWFFDKHMLDRILLDLKKALKGEE